MNTITITLFRLILFIPLLLLCACNEKEEAPITPVKPPVIVITPKKVCKQSSDSSANGTFSLLYNSQSQLTGFNYNSTTNVTLTYQGDSIFYTLNSDTLQFKEVFYKQDSLWKKSVQRININKPDENYVAELVITCTPSYTNGIITKINTLTETKFFSGGVLIPVPNDNGTIIINRNSNGEITRFIKNKNNQTYNYDLSYSTDTIGNNNVILYFSSLTEILEGLTIPTLLGAFNLSVKMPITFTFPKGVKSYTNWQRDSSGNLTNYNLIGTGDYEIESGSVKSTFTCK